MLKYIEKCTGAAHTGPAWIARVVTSKSGRTIYFGGLALKRAIGGMVVGNYFDADSGEEYWISGVKRNGADRHWAGNGRIIVDAGAVEEYLKVIGAESLDMTKFDVADIEPTDVAALHERENQPLD